MSKEKIEAYLKFIPSQIAKALVNREAELTRLHNHIDSFSHDKGRAGCTFGDTQFDSLSVVYGYNLAVDQFKEIIKTQDND